MEIGITGANGFIGKALYTALKDKHNVDSITRKWVDLTNRREVGNYLREKYYDVMIHCAAVGGHRTKADGASVIDQNLKMYYNLLDNKSSFVRFINLGSGAELYYKDSPYGLSKHVIRRSLLDKEGFYNIRVFNAFGADELDTRFIKSNILRYMKKESIELYENKKMDFFYIDDLVKVVEYYLEGSPPKEFDCTYKDSFYLPEIAFLINVLEKHSVRIITGAPGLDYVGKFTDIGIEYLGLPGGLLETYKKLITQGV